MNEFRDSYSEPFGCSYPELDEMTQLARDADVLGSRLTGSCFSSFWLGFVMQKSLTPSRVVSGAGFGAVAQLSLVLEDKVGRFHSKSTIML